MIRSGHRAGARQFRPTSPQTLFPPMDRPRAPHSPYGAGPPRKLPPGGTYAPGHGSFRDPYHPPGGKYGSYQGWMKNAKFFNRFMKRLPYAIPFAGLLDDYLNREPGAYGQPEWGFMLMPGTTAYCLNLNGMPLDGPWKVWSNPPQAVCGLQHGPAIPTQWYDTIPYNNFGGVDRGVYDHANGNYTCAYLRQVTPSPLSSPQIWFYGAMLLRSTTAGGGHPELVMPMASYMPVPNITTFPDDRWPPDMAPNLQPVVPGNSGTPLPNSVARRAGRFAPRPGQAPNPRPSPGPAPSPGPGPGPGAGPGPNPGPGPGGNPGGPGAPFIWSGWYGDTPRNPQWRNHRPPPYVGPEKKFQPSGPVARALEVAQGASEFADAIDAAYWALTPEARNQCRQAGLQGAFGRTVCVLGHTKDIDPEKFIKNLASGQVGDVAGGLVGKATRAWHRKNWNGGKGWDSRGRGPAETWKRSRPR